MFTLRTKMRKKISNEILRTSNSAKTYHELIKYYVNIEYRLREMNLLNKFKKNNNFKSSEERSQFNDKLINDRSHAKTLQAMRSQRREMTRKRINIRINSDRINRKTRRILNSTSR